MGSETPAISEVHAHTAVARHPLRTFLVTILLAAVFASGASHLLVHWLRIETTTGKQWSVGHKNAAFCAFLGGSSLAGDAVNWDSVAGQTGWRIFGWGVAGSSPYEWELLQKRAVESKASIIVVSPYDLNEAFLSDFRADVVPFTHAVRTLWKGHCSWDYSKRALSQYFIYSARKLFPTAGRSRGIMGELKDKVLHLLHRSAAVETDAGPTLAFGTTNAIPEYKRARVSDWSEGKLISKLDSLRAASRGEHSFQGVKNGALQRMVQFGATKGRVVVIVLPVSPAYEKAFLSPKILKDFEDSLDLVAKASPSSHWIRVDQIAQLHSNENFWDLVHMNADGQELATRTVLAELKAATAQ